VAQRRRGREARLAGMDVAAILGDDTRQIQNLNLAGMPLLDRMTRNLNEPPSLGHFSRTGVLAAWRSIDQENPA